jgi:DNA-binding transcriptional ArsR family regulator
MVDPHVAIFKSLSSRSRTTILKLLSQNGEMSVDELTAALELAGPTVSRHLQVLRQQDLVTVRRDAQSRYYSLDIKRLEQTFDAFLQYLTEES